MARSDNAVVRRLRSYWRLEAGNVILVPGVAALRAALNPPATDYLYFVARGDGSSEFSRTLEEHNRAVAQYIRKRNP